MIGTTFSHYRITAKIGAGGMGEVYRAHDERLDRDVAIKVLPEEVAQDAERLARFEREAKAVARLSHPNILEIHELGEHEGRVFMVTEILEGETLEDRIRRGALGWRKAAEIGAAIADGIAAAHQAGIVHRDLKPSNVFLTTDGRVKVLDFGLARSLEVEDRDESLSPTVSHYTDPGSILGTAGYMSPEQVRAETADHRSDIFSLGCVLYEMVCGRRAFSRDTAVETMNAILKEEPTDLGSLTGDLPLSVAGFIRRCLEKRPEARFQSGQDLAFALRSSLQDDSGPIARTATDEKSIVVLPFENLSTDPDQDFFSDGLTEEIISDLARIHSLRVISRTSAMQLKGTNKDLRTIGRELDVRYVLEGSVRRAGNALRITAQLIDAATDAHMWADKYNGTVDDVFDMQEKVSRSIVEALEVKLSPGEDRGFAERPAADVQVRELVLRARQGIDSVTDTGILSAIADLEVGLKEHGESAEILYHLAFGFLLCGDIGINVEGAVRKAEELARAFMRHEPDSWRGPHLLGRIERFRGNPLKGMRHFEHSYSLNPDSPDTLFWLVVPYCWQAGKPGVAVRIAKRLLAIEPLWHNSYFMMGMAYWFNGDLDKGIRYFERAVAMVPDDTLSRAWIAYIHMWKGEYEPARRLADEISSLIREPDTPPVWHSDLVKSALFALEGQSEQASEELSEYTRDFSWDDPDLPWLVAGIYALMNRKDEAYRWLEHYINRGSINYRLFVHDDPFYENLRGDKRFQEMMDEIKPKWEQFEIGIDLSGLPPASEEP
jgi:serine/threonine protein kinase/tetratricopeptide (TPR) repeat protein